MRAAGAQDVRRWRMRLHSNLGRAASALVLLEGTMILMGRTRLVPSADVSQLHDVS